MYHSSTVPKKTTPPMTGWACAVFACGQALAALASVVLQQPQCGGLTTPGHQTHHGTPSIMPIVVIHSGGG